MILGRLEKVGLRSIWKNEATHFTPWLGSEENFALLGATIQMDLEVVSQEEKVGLFRADILCKNIENDSYVLIENQFEHTDHKHLGQLLTYAAGLDAVTILWVAEHFTEEHRATLDWLNRLTAEDINFFGVEIELYRIGDSLAAPKFNLVAKPNNWAKHIRNAARNAEVSEIKQIQHQYWQEFKKLIEPIKGEFNLREPAPSYFYIITFGRGDSRLRVFANARDKRGGVIFVLRGPDANEKFHSLKSQYETEVASVFNNSVEWQFVEGREKQNIIYRIPDLDCLNKEDWKRQHQMLLEIVNKMYLYFIAKV